MQSKYLQTVSTKQLANELINRKGINNINISPYEEYKIVFGDESIKGMGPVILLIVTD